MFGVTKDDASAIEGDVSGGLSDRFLLSISLTGFALVGLALYAFVLRQASRFEGEDEEGNLSRTYEEELDDADVRTLNRAQLRARAKNRMKKARRIARETAANVDGEDNVDDDGGALDPDGEIIEADDGEDNSVQSLSVQHISRKERAKAAKAVEREERRRYAEMRREQTQALEKERREKEKEERALEKEARRKAEFEKRERERIEYEEWKYMFKVRKQIPNPDVDVMGTTVADFVKQARISRVMNIEDLANHYNVEPHDVEKRIRQLQQEGRIAGIIDETGHYIHITENDMKGLANLIRKKGMMKISDISRAISKLSHSDQGPHVE